MKNLIQLTLFFVLTILNAQEKSILIFKNGEAQIVESFNDQSQWIRHDLWVATTFVDRDRWKLPCVPRHTLVIQGLSGFV